MLCAQKNENYAKKKELRYRERNRQERIKYSRKLRELVKNYGSKSIVYVDESGFEEIETRIYAWSKRGKKVYGRNKEREEGEKI
jgi:RNA:NAD 2'-phosphotransferase (TPT1/KptA family)